VVTQFDKKGKELKRDGRSMKFGAPKDAPPTGRFVHPLNFIYQLERDPKAVRARVEERREGVAEVVRNAVWRVLGCQGAVNTRAEQSAGLDAAAERDRDARVRAEVDDGGEAPAGEHGLQLCVQTVSR
jgi:hypothetical protein